MATHPNILAWEIPWTEEPGGLCLWCHMEVSPTQNRDGWVGFIYAFCQWYQPFISPIVTPENYMHMHHMLLPGTDSAVLKSFGLGTPPHFKNTLKNIFANLFNVYLK